MVYRCVTGETERRQNKAAVEPLPTHVCCIARFRRNQRQSAGRAKRPAITRWSDCSGCTTDLVQYISGHGTQDHDVWKQEDWKHEKSNLNCGSLHD